MSYAPENHTAVRLDPYEAYADFTGQDRHYLHVVSRYSGSQEFLMLGSHHYTQPHVSHAFTRPLVEEWLETHSYHSPVAYQKDLLRGAMVLEGNRYAYGYGETFEDTIQHHFSELGLHVALADLYNVEVFSGEKPHHGIFKDVIDQLPVDEAWLYFRLREAPVWFRKPEETRPSFETYMKWMLDSYQKEFAQLALRHALPDLDYTLDGFLQHYRCLLGVEFDPASHAQNHLHLRITSAELEDPEFAARPVARIAPAVKRERDTYYVKFILGLLGQGRSVLGRFGKYHTLSMTPSFEAWGAEKPLPPEVAAHCARSGLYRVIELSRHASPDLPATRTWHQDFAVLQQSGDADDPWEKSMQKIENLTPSALRLLRTFYEQRTNRLAGGNLLSGDSGVFIMHILQDNEPWRPRVSSRMTALIDDYLSTCPAAQRPPYQRLNFQPGSPAYELLKRRISALRLGAQRKSLNNIAFFADSSADPRKEEVLTIIHTGFEHLTRAFQPEEEEVQKFDRIVVRMFENFDFLNGYQENVVEATLAFNKAAIHLAVIRRALEANVKTLGLTSPMALFYCLDTLNRLYDYRDIERRMRIRADLAAATLRGSETSPKLPERRWGSQE